MVPPPTLDPGSQQISSDENTETDSCCDACGCSCGDSIGMDQCFMCNDWVCDLCWPEHGLACTQDEYTVGIWQDNDLILVENLPLGTSVGAIYRWVERCLGRDSCDFLLTWRGGQFEGEPLSMDLSLDSRFPGLVHRPAPCSLDEDRCFNFVPFQPPIV